MIEIIPDVYKLAKTMGISEDELSAVLRSLVRPPEKLTEFKQVWMNEPPKKTEQVVVCDNGSRYGPPPGRGRDSRRGRSRRQRDNLPTLIRPSEEERFPLTRVDYDSLETRLFDDSRRTVSEDPID